MPVHEIRSGSSKARQTLEKSEEGREIYLALGLLKYPTPPRLTPQPGTSHRQFVRVPELSCWAMGIRNPDLARARAASD